jgi:hypothetical protein
MKEVDIFSGMKEENFANPELKKEVEKDSPLKDWLVDYVGDKVKPADGLVTLEMIVDVVAKEFPGFLLAVAEENFIRGYNQAMTDIENPPEELKKLKKSKKKK